MTQPNADNGGPTNDRKNREPILSTYRTARGKHRSMMRADQNPLQLSTPLLAQAFAEMAEAGLIIKDDDEF